MSIFEFLMIMQSIIIGLGISELLTGLAKLLKSYKLKELGIIVPSLILTVFIALLQMFWESWGFHTEIAWTVPAMIFMLISPIIMNLIAHIIFPPLDEKMDITKYYLSKSTLIWSLATFATITSTTFRPFVFGSPLFIVDNYSSLLQIAFCILLIFNKKVWLHRVVVPTAFIIVILDLLAINYQIN